MLNHFGTQARWILHMDVASPACRPTLHVESETTHWVQLWTSPMHEVRTANQPYAAGSGLDTRSNHWPTPCIILFWAMSSGPLDSAWVQKFSNRSSGSVNYHEASKAIAINPVTTPLPPLFWTYGVLHWARDSALGPHSSPRAVLWAPLF